MENSKTHDSSVVVSFRKIVRRELKFCCKLSLLGLSLSSYVVSQGCHHTTYCCTYQLALVLCQLD